jgi:hypothetical protein
MISFGHSSDALERAISLLCGAAWRAVLVRQS